MKSIPDIKSFFYEVALYEEFEIDDDNIFEAVGILIMGQQFDGYCRSCNKESIMSVDARNGLQRTNDKATAKSYLHQASGMITRVAECGRNNGHKIIINIMVSTKVVHNQGKMPSFSTYFQKIGQHPSIADLTFPQMDKYRKMLGKNSAEFNKAIGLFTHGVGIGSFVYLRRIFECFIEEAHQEAKLDIQWDEDAFSRCRMDDKIDMLKNCLPSFLVKNRKLYGILSKGIHELTEDECLQYFPIVKTGITLILDEKIREKEKEDEIQQAEKQIAELAGRLK